MNAHDEADSNLTQVIVFLIIFSWCLTSLVFILNTMSSSTQQVAGWVAVIGAAIIFGGTGIPMKYKVLEEVKVNPSIFSLYTGIGVFLNTIPVTIYLITISQFQFVPYSILGATFISIIGYFAFIAVQNLGYARGPAIWAAVGMITAYLWGLIYFQEPTSDIYLSTFAILFLIIGVYCVSTSQSTEVMSSSTQEDFNSSGNNVVDSPGTYSIANEAEDDDEIEFILSPFDYKSNDADDVDENNNINHTTNRQNKNDDLNRDQCDEEKAVVETNNNDSNIPDHMGNKPHPGNSYSQLSSDAPVTIPNYASVSYGFSFCLLTGLLDGSLMLPFKLASSETPIAILQYISSFSIAAGVVAPTLFLLYTLAFRPRETPLRVDELRTGAFPGISSGALWGAGNRIIIVYVLVSICHF